MCTMEMKQVETMQVWKKLRHYSVPAAGHVGLLLLCFFCGQQSKATPEQARTLQVLSEACLACNSNWPYRADMSHFFEGVLHLYTWIYETLVRERYNYKMQTN